MQSFAVTLIGMPGTGKSTIGVLLAKRLVLHFVDTDLLIQARTGESLQQTMDRDGYLHLRRIEEQVLLELNADEAVIATGGSAVYSEAAMAHLGSQSTIVHLDASLEVVRQRIGNFADRGIARAADQSLEDLYHERQALYRRWAQITIDAAMSVEAVLEATCVALADRPRPQL